MRAAVLDESGLKVREWPEPEPGPGEALVALKKVGICGSDVHFVLDGTARTKYLPIVLGHEPAGVVEALGPDTEGPAPGTRVAIMPLVTCMACDRCLNGWSCMCKERLCIGADVEGCWADLTVVPARNLVPLPDNLSDELAATATDSVATAYHAVKERGNVGEGSRVAVWGTGGLGLSAVGLSKWLGASSVIAVDPRPEAREWALETGADEAVHPDQALGLIADRGFVDVALEFVGRESSVEGAVRSLDDRGRAVIVGLSDAKTVAGRLMTFVLREREVVGSYGNEPSDVREMVEALASGSLVLPKVVGDVIALEDVAEGVARVQRGDTGGSRIVVDIAD